MAVALHVYSASSPTTLLDTVDTAYEVRWLGELEGPGGGSFKIPHDAAELVATPTLLDSGNIVRVLVDGTARHAWRILRKTRTRGDSFHTITVSGPGIRTVLSTARVWPEYDLDRLTSDVVTFGAMHNEFDDASWVAALEEGTQASPDFAGKATFPQGWVDPAAQWITAGATGYVAADAVRYLRYEFTPAGTGAVQAVLQFAADDNAVVWFDGVKVIDQDPESAWNWVNAHNLQITLDLGVNHTILIVLRNVPRPTNTSPCQALLSLVEAAADGMPREGGEVYVRSSTAWKGLADPASPPGMTPGQMLRILIAGEQSRGRLTGVTLGCTDPTDTDGVTWGTYELGFPVGDSLEDVCQRLRDLDVHTAMTPTLRLDAWDDRGTDRSATVTLAASHCSSVSTDRDDEIVDGFLIRAQDGWSAYPSSTEARMDFLPLGAVPSAASAAQVIADLAAVMGAARDTTTNTWPQELGPDPYADFDLGDRITAPGWSGQQSQRVLSIAGAEAEQGSIDWTSEMQP